GPRPHRRGRRLHDQALQPRGAGRPHQDDPAPHRAGRRGVRPPAVRRPRAGRGVARGAPRRHAGRADGDRVPAAALPDAQPARTVADQDGARRRLRAASTARVMSSLRARVLASVLVLAAIGMVAVAAVTYAEQRSFLYSRLDDQARGALPYMSRLLDSKGFGVPAAPGLDREDPGHAPGEEGPPGFNAPPGTYGQRRDARGEVIGQESFNYGQSSGSEPKLPAHVALNAFTTVGSVSPGGPRYRVYARQDPEDPGITVVAVPLGETDQTLHRLLLVEALVIAAALIALGAS